ncbi:MAG: DUF692 family multinuclear iron-containing protein [Woeseia sp.]
MSVAARKPSAASELGLGLRPLMYAKARRGEIPVDWFEVITENFMVPGGQPLAVLEDVRRQYPIAFHGVSMNLGGTDPLDQDYLTALKTLADRFEPVSISDHLADRIWRAQGEETGLRSRATRRIALSRAARFRPEQARLERETLAVLSELGTGSSLAR